MAISFEIEKKYPRIVFLDGSFGIIYRKGIPEGNPERQQFWILPTAPTIRAANLQMSRLDEPNPLASEHREQVYKQNYDPNLILPLTDNPEYPISLGLCNIKGQQISIGSKSFAPFYNLHMKVDGLQSRVKSLEIEKAKLEARLRDVIVSAYRMKRENDSMRESERRSILPHEVKGMQVTTKSEV